MSLHLNKIFDRRSALEKARRKELERFAKANGIAEIKCGMPAPVMRAILEARGYTNIDLPRTRYLGGPNDMQRARAEPVDPVPVKEYDEIAALEAAWRKEQEPSLDDLSINELRAECKARGIKLSRRDNMESLRRKLLGKDATERSE